ncbi:MAG: alpha/beta hydrolase [Xanthomonadales bacterium]|nr:alpha/beta hydrolase [Xanthomonadales bacterium]MBK7145388.1 alpha/beta hydrolase [Xanthomonadales bacterium]
MSPASCPAAAPPARVHRELRRFPRPGGLALAIEHFGSPANPPLVFAHGFGQSRLAWTVAAEHLAQQGFHCLALDGRGHGESDWDDGVAYELERFVDDAVAIARSLPRPPVWVGASMGGLIGMMAEAAQPGLFEALVLVDVTPRWETSGVNRILEFMRAHPHGFASVEEASAAVAAYLPHRAQRNDPGRLQKMLVPMANGRLRWHWDPRLLDTVAGDNGARYVAGLTAAASALRLPVLLISGGRSDVVSDHTIDEFQKLVPHAEHERIDEATHMVVGDANDVFVSTIARYLQRLAARTA